MVVDPSILCITGLVFGLVAFLYFLHWLRTGSSEDGRLELPNWVKKLSESKAWIAAQVMISLVFVVGVGSIIGVVIWEVMKGIAEVVKILPEVFVASTVGAVISTIGFGLFTLILSLFGPILSVVYEKWTGYIAPVIGGVVGAAIRDENSVSVIYIMALSGLTGGIMLLVYEMLIAKERVAFKGITEIVIAGVGFGVVNGVIVAAVFKVLEITVGIGWLAAG